MHETGKPFMRTIQEYKEYCKQLECEIKKWKDAYCASQVHVRQLIATVKEIRKTAKECKDILAGKVK